MKRFILPLLFCVLLCSCMATNDTWGLSMTGEQVSPTGITLLVTQDGSNYPGTELYSGSLFTLECKTDNGWQRVDYLIDEEMLGWNAEQWPIADKSETRWEENWEWLHGALVPGEYRISKVISNGLTEQTYYVEFQIP